MKRAKIPVLLLVILMLLISSCNGPPPEEVLPVPLTPPIGEEPSPLEEKCIDFTGFLDDATFGPSFTLGGVQFSAMGTRDLFVNDVTPSVHGLVFDDGGIQIDLPRPSSAVTLSTGAWYPQPLEITAMDNNANTVDQVMDPADNSLHTYALGGTEITTIVITGGGGEGVLVEICWAGF